MERPVIAITLISCVSAYFAAQLHLYFPNAFQILSICIGTIGLVCLFLGYYKSWAILLFAFIITLLSGLIHYHFNHDTNYPDLDNIEKIDRFRILEHASFENYDLIKMACTFENRTYHIQSKFHKKIQTQLYTGDSIFCKLLLRLPQHKKLFENFDPIAYYANAHIQFLANCYDTSYVKINAGYSLQRLSQQCQQYYSSLIHTYFTNNTEAALMCGFIIGLKKDIPKEIKQSFANTGTSHILTVSGLHIGMVYLILKTLLSLLLPLRFKNSKGKLMVILTGIWTFCFISGLSAAVLRSGIMFTLFEFGINIKRYTSSLCTLFGTIFILVFISPCQIFDLGLILSFFAVLSIILYQEYIRKIFVTGHFILNKIWESAAVSISVQVLLLPINLFYFHTFPIYFLPANLFWIPTSFLLMLIGIFIIPIHFISAKISFYLSQCASSLINLGLRLFKGLEQLPLFTIDGVFLTSLQVVIIIIICLFFYKYLSTKKSNYYLYICILLILYTVSFAFDVTKKSSEQRILLAFQNNEFYIEWWNGKQLLSSNKSLVEKNSAVWNFRKSNYVEDYQIIYDSTLVVGQLQEIQSHRPQLKFIFLDGQNAYQAGDSIIQIGKFKNNYNLDTLNNIRKQYKHSLKTDGAFLINY